MIPGSPATAALRHLLTELAGTRHTGALHVEGFPGGTFYLSAGRIVYAESPACPGIDARLVASGRLAEATWRAAYHAGYADCRVGAVLVEQGHLVQGELVCRVLAGICDATHAILQGDGARVHFVPGERHWLGQVTQLELTALSRETARRLRAATPRPSATPQAPQQQVPEQQVPAQQIPAQPVPEQRGAGPETVPPTRNVLPVRRTDPRTANAWPLGEGGNAPHFTPDYATLKRIRQTLKSID